MEVGRAGNGRPEEWSGSEREMRRRVDEETRPDDEKGVGDAQKSGLHAE
jgi:hypothetical protein